MTDEWRRDPFHDPDDPDSVARAQRRREREEKRRGKAAPAAPPPPPAEVEPNPPADPPGGEPSGEPAYHDEGDPEMAAAGGGRPDGGNRGRGFLGALARHPFRVLAVLLAIFVLWSLNELFQPFHGSPGAKVEVTIPKGAGAGEIGDLLEEKGVIDDSTLFQIRATLSGQRSELYSGHYTLAEGMSYGEALDALSKPPVRTVLTVTVPPGYNRHQAAQLISADGVRGDYVKATVSSKYLNPAKYGGKGAKSLEGFLFPDTFELKPKEPVDDLVQLQLEDFKRRIKGVDMRYAKSKNLTVFDVLTIASMIQDESGVEKQDKLVASVIYNRLHEGMPLGIDATIRYATGNYDAPLTESQLAVDSPYNTRTNAGLPPGPINSPGLAAIEAAAHPEQTGYLYYVTDPKGCNELTFAKTEAEFEAAVAAYNSAREANGGNAPNTCGE